MPEPSPSLDHIDITLQLAAAFGQGAGTMLIEAGALRPAYDAYSEHFARAVPFWATDALTSISVMRAMGAVRGPPGPVGPPVRDQPRRRRERAEGGDAHSRRAAWHLPDHRALKRQGGQWRSSCCWGP